MENEPQLTIEELIVAYKEYMGVQAQEIVVLKATVEKLRGLLAQKSDEV